MPLFYDPFSKDKTIKGEYYNNKEAQTACFELMKQIKAQNEAEGKSEPYAVDVIHCVTGEERSFNTDINKIGGYINLEALLQTRNWYIKKFEAPKPPEVQEAPSLDKTIKKK